MMDILILIPNSIHIPSKGHDDSETKEHKSSSSNKL